MNWFEDAEAQFLKYLKSEIDVYEWADQAEEFMGCLLGINEELLNKVRNEVITDAQLEEIRNMTFYGKIPSFIKEPIVHDEGTRKNCNY